MPLDYRRFNGPEDSVSYKKFTTDYLRSYDELLKKLLDENGKRKGGRAMDEARSLCMFYARSGMVSQAKGSSYVELKKTKVVCSVFDPRETVHQNEFSELGQIFCEVKFAPFSCPRKRRSHAPDAEERALSAELKKAMEPVVCRHLFPNFQLDIFVYILEHDGACLAAAINAVGLALSDAAVPMYDIISACSVAVIGDQIFVDPTEEEEHLALMSPETETNHGIVTMCLLHNLKQVTNYRLIGSMDVDCVTRVMAILESECEKIIPVIRRAVVMNVVRQFEQHKKLVEEAKLREQALNAMVEEWKSLLNGG